MSRITSWAVADLLTQAGIIRDPNIVKSVTLRFDADQSVTCTIEQYVDRPTVETVVSRLRVVEPGE